MNLLRKCPLCALEFNSVTRVPMNLQCGLTVCSVCAPTSVNCSVCKLTHDWPAQVFLSYKDLIHQHLLMCYKNDNLATLIDTEHYLPMCVGCKTDSKFLIPIDYSTISGYLFRLLEHYASLLKDINNSSVYAEFLGYFSVNNQKKLEKIRWAEHYLASKAYCAKHPLKKAQGLKIPSFKFFCECKPGTKSLKDSSLPNIIKKHLRYVSPLSNYLITCAKSPDFNVIQAAMEIKNHSKVISIHNLCPVCLKSFGEVRACGVRCLIEGKEDCDHVICEDCIKESWDCRIDGGVLIVDERYRARVEFQKNCIKCQSRFLKINLGSENRLPFGLPCFHNLCYRCCLESEGCLYCTVCKRYFPDFTADFNTVLNFLLDDVTMG